MVLTLTVDITYFELSWAALSALGLHNVLVGLMIAAIVGRFPFVLIVPLVVSAACALANGLCFFVYYTNYPDLNKAVASPFLDLFWTIQEVGLTFYGYAILIHALFGAERRLFLTIFWTLIFITLSVRSAIIVLDVCFFVDVHTSHAWLSYVVDRLHLGYFVPIALSECLSAFFLLKKFREVVRSSTLSPSRSGNLYLYLYLTRSTEIRVSMLAAIGISRAVTFSFHTIGHEGVGMAGQFDLFAYMMGSFFPIVMYVDILASRLVSAVGDHAPR